MYRAPVGAILSLGVNKNGPLSSAIHVLQSCRVVIVSIVCQDTRRQSGEWREWSGRIITYPKVQPSTDPNHNSRPSAHPSTARPRAHNQTQACPASRSRRCASHKATWRAPSGSARPAGGDGCGRRGRPRSASTGRAAGARGGAAACARAASAWVCRGSTPLWCAGTSMSRGRASPRPEDTSLLPVVVVRRRLLLLEALPLRLQPQPTPRAQWRTRRRAPHRLVRHCFAFLPELCSSSWWSDWSWVGSSSGRRCRFCRVCRLVRGRCLGGAGGRYE